MSKSTALWSEMGKSVISRLVGVMSVQQIKSSMWPLLWVGRLTCCVIQSRSDVKSLARVLDGLSMWMLKSPRRITVEDITHTDVSSDENSLRKTAEGFGGL